MAGIYSPITPADTRPDTATVINVGKVSSVLAMYDLLNNKGYKGGSKTPSNPLWIWLGAISEILDWHNTYVPNASNVEVIANYLWFLITPYQIAALRALGNGNGVVINPQTGAPINIAQFRYDFVVGESGSLMNNGDSSLTLALSGVIMAQFQANGVNEMLATPDQASLTSIVYQPNYVQFNLNQAVQNGERYIVWGLRGGNVTNIGGGGVVLPQPYQQGKFLTNDGTALAWDDVYLPITAADFESDGKTYINSILANYKYDIDWLNLPTTLYESNNDFTRILSGGFTINLDGFDTTQNPDWKFRLIKRGISS